MPALPQLACSDHKGCIVSAGKPQLCGNVCKRMPGLKHYLSALHCTLLVAGPLCRNSTACLCEKHLFGVRSDGDAKACSMAA